MALAHFRMLIHELLNKDPDIVPEEASLIVLDSKSAMWMAKNGKDTKHTRHISRRIYFVRNGEKCKMHKTDWCEGGLQLADIGNNNVSEPDITPIGFVHIAFISNPLKMHSPCNLYSMFDILTIISHTHRRLNIQDNQRSFLRKYVCILVQQFMN